MLIILVEHFYPAAAIAAILPAKPILFSSLKRKGKILKRLRFLFKSF